MRTFSTFHQPPELRLFGAKADTQGGMDGGHVAICVLKDK
jgi:hypothetical protein